MAVRIVRKDTKPNPTPTSLSQNLLPPIPAISSPKPARANIIIRAIKIMLMDIRIRLYPQTKEDLEKYSRFSDLAYGRK